LITDDRGLHFAGGGVEIVTVAATGVERRTLRKYRRDQVGKVVRPSFMDRVL